MKIFLKLTYASKSPGDSTKLSITVWVLETKFKRFVWSAGDGVKSWFRLSSAWCENKF